MLKKTVYETKIGEIKKKITVHDPSNSITNQEFNKLTTKNFKDRLKIANLVSKTGFENKLISFNRKITSNNTNYVELQKKPK